MQKIKWALPGWQFLVLCLSLPLNALAAEDWLIASSSTQVHGGQELSIAVIKPDSVSDWPQQLLLSLSAAGSTEQVQLSLQPAKHSARREYKGVPRQDYIGVVRASLVERASNQMLLLAVNEADIGALAALPVDKKRVVVPEDRPLLVFPEPGEQPALTAYEPTYFVFGAGGDNGLDARFQLSFKYRLFDPEGPVARFSPLLSNLHFTYAQTSLWDLGGDSSPFRDTSYRPGFMYHWVGSGQKLRPDEWRGGFEHESNGREDPDSRSINIAYIRPSWHLDLANGKRFTFSPRFYHYLEKSDNSDIQRYRGYADWQMRYGREDGWMLSGLYRQGTGGYASGQIDLSYPLSQRIFSRIGAFAHLQLLSGYGETLLEYNKRSDTQLRLGLSIVR
ncbi:phospholipase A [Methylobacillus flagellatus]|uniref:phospholipase A n=1 Tax=Methylobacillus flagellatus TaxID=405 RepID=UPI0010FA2CCE|nr:phospholipase A [Methylobacillus flagellatus]